VPFGPPSLPSKDSAVYREELYVLYLDYRKQGCGMMKACEKSNLTPRQIRNRRNLDADFLQAEQDAQARYNEDMEEIVQDTAFGRTRTELVEMEDGTTAKVTVPIDPQAAKDWLKAYKPEAWNPSSKITVDHTHKLDIKALFIDVESTEES
jgi:hypothetical protein